MSIGVEKGQRYRDMYFNTVFEVVELVDRGAVMKRVDYHQPHEQLFEWSTINAMEKV